MIERISPRERLLLAVVAGAIFVLVNMWMISAFMRHNNELKGEIASKRLQLDSLKAMVKDRDQWATRDAWLKQKQPRLTNADQAGVNLLEQVKQVAQSNEVLLESPEIGTVEKQPAGQAIFVSVQTKSSWDSLVKFLQAIQGPDQFIVFENANLQIDNTDPTQMRGKFRIAKWYAPQS